MENLFETLNGLLCKVTLNTRVLASMGPLCGIGFKSSFFSRQDSFPHTFDFRDQQSCPRFKHTSIFGNANQKAKNQYYFKRFCSMRSLARTTKHRTQQPCCHAFYDISTQHLATRSLSMISYWTASFESMSETIVPMLFMGPWWW